MLVAVVDRVGGNGASRVRSAFEDVEEQLAAKSVHVAWPVSIEIVNMDIMGATNSEASRHTVYVSSWALRTDMLDGLLAHETGHMVLRERGSPSHDPAVHARIAREIRLPAQGRAIFGSVLNHVQNIYADDIAFLANLGDRVYDFFASWIGGNVTHATGERWQDLSLSVSNGFALGNLDRHGLLAADDILWERARSFDRQAGFGAVDYFAGYFARLRKGPTEDEYIAQVRDLSESLVRVANARTF